MKINKQSVLIGSDFEMFLVDTLTGKVKSAIPFIFAGKRLPEETPKKGCCIQHDGVLAECNIPPVKLEEHALFHDNVKYVKNYIHEKFGRELHLELVCCPSAELDEDQLQHPEAIQSGCEPSFNAWDNGNVNEKCEYSGSRVRVAGGHIHFSGEGFTTDICLELMRVFDVFVTIPCLFMDTDERRRQFYGKAGEMRLCEWGEIRGFEARTLSNFWVDDAEYIEYIFNQINKMFDYYNEHGISEIDKIKDDVISAINNNNKEIAGSICDKFENFILFKEEKILA